MERGGYKIKTGQERSHTLAPMKKGAGEYEEPQTTGRFAVIPCHDVYDARYGICRRGRCSLRRCAGRFVVPCAASGWRERTASPSPPVPADTLSTPNRRMSASTAGWKAAGGRQRLAQSSPSLSPLTAQPRCFCLTAVNGSRPPGLKLTLYRRAEPWM